MGAAAIGTAPQMVVSSDGRWRLVYHEVRVRETNIAEFRSLIGYLAGRLQPVYVGPMNDIYRPAKRAGVTTPILRNFSDTFAFTDSTQFSETIANCTLSAAAKAGGNQISVTNSSTAPLAAGDYFELRGRLHLVEDISGTTWTIWPKLRADYASGAKLEIDQPMMLARLDPKSQALATRLDLAWTGLTTFEFVEEPW